jgi:hypothetical protein
LHVSYYKCPRAKVKHGAPLLLSLNWLSVNKRITYKMAVITYKVKKSSTPAYLHNMLMDRLTSSSMVLRSSIQPMPGPSARVALLLAIASTTYYLDQGY